MKCKESKKIPYSELFFSEESDKGNLKVWNIELITISSGVWQFLAVLSLNMYSPDCSEADEGKIPLFLFVFFFLGKVVLYFGNTCFFHLDFIYPDWTCEPQTPSYQWEDNLTLLICSVATNTVLQFQTWKEYYNALIYVLIYMLRYR